MFQTNIVVNVVLSGNMAIIDYDSVIIDKQPYATKHLSINPYFQYKKIGKIQLDPNMDTWSDVTRAPTLTVNVDTGVDELRQLGAANGLIGKQWGAWSQVNQTILQVDAVGPGSASAKPKTVTVIDQLRTGQEVTISNRTTAYNLGDKVTDVSLDPFMRRIDIYFYATQMKANTKVYPFFDGKSVSEFTRPRGRWYGDELVTDANGQIFGIFSCPDGVFHTGDRKFKLSADKNQTGDQDLEVTMAEAVFFAGGLNTTKQQTTMNVITPDTTVECILEKQTVIDNTIKQPGVFSCTDTRVDQGIVCNGCHKGENCLVPTSCGGCKQRCGCCNFCPECLDPVAQGFKLEEDHFITGLDIFFKSVDTNAGNDVSFEIRTMVNGYPTKEIIGKKEISPALIKPYISEDSKKAFHVNFDFPIFVKGKTAYCFVIAGWSPETRIWLSRVGQTIVDMPGKTVETQPSIESSFRSQNGETWNAEQYEDIKYNLYAAKFKSQAMTVDFTAKPEKTRLMRDPFEAEAGKNLIRVYAEDHGLLPNDKTTISLYNDGWFEISVLQGQITIGMPIRNTNSSFSGKITDFKTSGGRSFIKIGDMKGSFTNGSNFICDQTDIPVPNSYLVNKINYIGKDIQNGFIRANAASGIFKESSPDATKFNGISFSELSKQHTVLTVDSMDTFIIQTTSNANSSGRFGGEGGTITMNEKYELFNVSGAYLNYGAYEEWTYRGVGHNTPNGPFTSQNYQPLATKALTVNNDMFLGVPHKMVCSDNLISASRNTKVSVKFTNMNQWVSPVINTDSFSITTVSNRVEWTSPNQINVEPNSSNRFKGESDPMNGSENFKYVTKTINLANPASDLVIAFDVYKDINSDYDIWIKVLAPYDNEDIDSKRWMKILGLDKSHHSADLTDRVEYEITMNKMQLGVYSNDSDYVIKEWEDVVNDTSLFSSFKIKIVGKAKNPALPPLFQSLRCIAVT